LSISLWQRLKEKWNNPFNKDNNKKKPRLRDLTPWQQWIWLALKKGTSESDDAYQTNWKVVETLRSTLRIKDDDLRTGEKYNRI